MLRMFPVHAAQSRGNWGSGNPHGVIPPVRMATEQDRSASGTNVFWGPWIPITRRACGDLPTAGNSIGPIGPGK
jgi:hypothetical protein